MGTFEKAFGMLMLGIVLGLGMWVFSPSNPMNQTNQTTQIIAKPDIPIISAIITPPETPAKTIEPPKQEFINQNSSGIKCLHGIIVSDWKGKEWCVLNVSREAYRNQTLWLENQTLYNQSMNITKNQTYYLYFRDNCTTIPEGYIWQSSDFIVNSSHEIDCQQIKNWKKNDGYI